MLDRLRQEFLRCYGTEPQAIVRAPGRVNLIGEHTDYNQGFVLPCAIEQHSLVAISLRDDAQVHCQALNYPGQADSFRLDQPLVRHPQQPWASYVRGVAGQCMARGLPMRGCNLAVVGNVPQGAGLSSSAALEVALAKAFAVANNQDFDTLTLAQIGQDTENAFIGSNTGIMDQLISAGGQAGCAVAIDCRDFSLRPVPMPAQLSIVLINSNVQRQLVDSAYNERRGQCEAAARHCGVDSLRDVTLADFARQRASMDPLAASRAQHVLEENARTLAAADALAANDVAKLSSLMAASHASMRDLFEITVPPVDILVETVAEVLGSSGGVRMTGGGFGGCVVALVPADAVDAVVARVQASYQASTGLQANIYFSKAAGGVERLC